MDRNRANFITTELVGFDYVEIRTLSGGIGITELGIDAARNLGAEGGKQKNPATWAADPYWKLPAKMPVIQW
jgi:hypothetical protein